MTERNAARPTPVVIAAPDARRVGLISDTHGPLAPGVAEALDDCDLVLHAGDVGAVAALGPFGRGAVHAVAGNNDIAPKWAPAERAAIARLHPALRVDLPGGLLVVIHGHQARSAARRHAVLRAWYPDVRAVVYGHSHRPVVDAEGTPAIVNPGASGRTRTFGGAALVILEIVGRRWEFQPRRLG